ncbi:MAG: hypothetical protein ACNS63_00845 [Candidatus Nitrospinota bacterium M3_3B_026]
MSDFVKNILAKKHPFLWGMSLNRIYGGLDYDYDEFITRNGFESDLLNMVSDWQAVGDDLKEVMKRYETVDNV